MCFVVCLFIIRSRFTISTENVNARYSLNEGFGKELHWNLSGIPFPNLDSHTV